MTDSIIKIPSRGSIRFHPQLTSYRLATKAIQSADIRGLQVLDPFCGTGTIVCASVEHGARKAIGSDIEDYTFCSRSAVYLAAHSKALGDPFIEVHYGVDVFDAVSAFPYDILITDPPNPGRIVGGTPISVKRDTGYSGGEIAKFWKNRFSDHNLINKKKETQIKVAKVFGIALDMEKRVIANLFKSGNWDYGNRSQTSLNCGILPGHTMRWG